MRNGLARPKQMDAFSSRLPTMKHREKIPENPAIPAAVLTSKCVPKLCLGEMSVSKMVLCCLLFLLPFGPLFCWGVFYIGFPCNSIGSWMGFDDLSLNLYVVGFKTDVDSKTSNILIQTVVHSFSHGWGRTTRDHG
jgi:hypothetical protein